MISELFTRSSSFFTDPQDLNEEAGEPCGAHRIFVVNVHRCRGQSDLEPVTPSTTALISGENAYIASGMREEANAVWESEFAIDIDLDNSKLRSEVFCVCIIEASSGNAVGSVYIPYWEVMELQPHAQHRHWRSLQRPSKAINGALQAAWKDRRRNSTSVESGGQYWPLCEVEISIAIVKVRSLPRLLTLVSDYRREVRASCQEHETALKSLGDEALGGSLAKKLKALKTTFLDKKGPSTQVSESDESLFRELEEFGDTTVSNEITYASRLSQLVCVGFNLLVQELENMEVPLPPRSPNKKPSPLKKNSSSSFKKQSKTRLIEDEDPDDDDNDHDGDEEESDEIKTAELAFKTASELALEVALPTVEFLKEYSLEVTKGAEERQKLLEQALARYQNSIVREDPSLKDKQEEEKAEQERRIQELQRQKQLQVEQDESRKQDEMEQQRIELERDLETLRESLRIANEKLAASQETIATLTEDNTNLFEKWSSLEVVEERADEMEKKIIDLEVENLTVKTALKEAEAQKLSADSIVEELTKTNRELQEEVENLFASAAGISPSSL